MNLIILPRVRRVLVVRVQLWENFVPSSDIASLRLRLRTSYAKSDFAVVAYISRLLGASTFLSFMWGL